MDLRKTRGLATLAVTIALALPNLANASTMTQTSEVTQAGKYEVHRSLFGSGGHGWLTAPFPQGSDGFATTNWAISFSNLVPLDAILQTALLTWVGLSPLVSTAFKEYDFFCGGRPICYDAAIQRVTATGRANITGVSIDDVLYPVSASAASGSIDLLSLGLGTKLFGSHTVSLVGTNAVQVGRIYFDREGRNSRTYFNVSATSRLNLSSSLSVLYTLSEPPAATTPEPPPAALLLAGLMLIAFGVRTRQREASKIPLGS